MRVAIFVSPINNLIITSIVKNSPINLSMKIDAHGCEVEKDDTFDRYVGCGTAVFGTMCLCGYGCTLIQQWSMKMTFFICPTITRDKLHKMMTVATKSQLTHRHSSAKVRYDIVDFWCRIPSSPLPGLCDPAMFRLLAWMIIRSYKFQSYKFIHNDFQFIYIQVSGENF